MQSGRKVLTPSDQELKEAKNTFAQLLRDDSNNWNTKILMANRSGNPLLKDALRNILINGESFKTSPEYDPNISEASLEMEACFARFVKRALFNNKQELFDKHYANLLTQYGQPVWSVSANMINDAFKTEGLPNETRYMVDIQHLSTLINFKFDEKNDTVYTDVHLSNFKLTEHPPKDDAIPVGLPGSIYSRMDLKQNGFVLNSFDPSNPFLAKLALSHFTEITDRKNLFRNEIPQAINLEIKTLRAFQQNTLYKKHIESFIKAFNKLDLKRTESSALYLSILNLTIFLFKHPSLENLQIYQDKLILLNKYKNTKSLKKAMKSLIESFTDSFLEQALTKLDAIANTRDINKTFSSLSKKTSAANKKLELAQAINDTALLIQQPKAVGKYKILTVKGSALGKQMLDLKKESASSLYTSTVLQLRNFYNSSQKPLDPILIESLNQLLAKLDKYFESFSQTNDPGDIQNICELTKILYIVQNFFESIDATKEFDFKKFLNPEKENVISFQNNKGEEIIKVIEPALTDIATYTATLYHLEKTAEQVEKTPGKLRREDSLLHSRTMREKYKASRSALINSENDPNKRETFKSILRQSSFLIKASDLVEALANKDELKTEADLEKAKQFISTTALSDSKEEQEIADDLTNAFLERAKSNLIVDQNEVLTENNSADPEFDNLVYLWNTPDASISKEKQAERDEQDNILKLSKFVNVTLDDLKSDPEIYKSIQLRLSKALIILQEQKHDELAIREAKKFFVDQALKQIENVEKNISNLPLKQFIKKMKELNGLDDLSNINKLSLATILFETASFLKNVTENSLSIFILAIHDFISAMSEAGLSVNAIYSMASLLRQIGQEQVINENIKISPPFNSVFDPIDRLVYEKFLIKDFEEFIKTIKPENLKQDVTYIYHNTRELYDAHAIDAIELINILSATKEFVRSNKNLESAQGKFDAAAIAFIDKLKEKNYVEIETVLIGFEALCYSKVKTFFEDLLTPPLIKDGNQFIKTTNEAIKANALTTNQLTDILHIIVHLLESDKDEGFKDFNTQLDKLIGELPENDETIRVIAALFNLAFTKAKTLYSKSIQGLEVNKSQIGTTNNFVDLIENTSLMSKYHRMNLLVSTSGLNYSNWNTINKEDSGKAKEQMNEANNALILFNTSVDNLVKATKEKLSELKQKKDKALENYNQINKTKNASSNDKQGALASYDTLYKKYRQAQADDRKSIRVLNELRYQKAFSSLENTANALKKVNPYLFGVIDSLLADATRIKSYKKLTSEEMGKLCQFLLNVSFALQNPVAYVDTKNEIKLDNKLESLAKFQGIILKKYIPTEAGYLRAEKELITAINSKEFAKSPTRDLVIETCREVRRQKSIHPKEYFTRTPELTDTLKVMNDLLKKPSDPSVHNRAFDLAVKLNRYTWSDRIVPLIGMTVGIFLTPILGLGVPLVYLGVKKLQKMDYVSFGKVSSFMISTVNAGMKAKPKEENAGGLKANQSSVPLSRGSVKKGNS